MARRKRKSTKDSGEIHREMLEHLRQNPPPPPKKRPLPPPPADPPPPRPQLMLRRLLLETAMHRLETFVTQHRRKGTPEVVIVTGRGLRSGEAGPVIGPAVQEWCDAHPERVRRWNFAPADEGGSGALVLELIAEGSSASAR